IVVEFLQQRAPEALSGPADDLPLDQHGIDDHATIVGDDIFFDVHSPEFDIDVHRRHMRRIRPRDRRRLVIVGFLEPGIEARRPGGRPGPHPGRAARATAASETSAPGTPTMPTPFLRSSRSPTAHSRRLAVMANTLTRSRSLAP